MRTARSNRVCRVSVLPVVIASQDLPEQAVRAPRACATVAGNCAAKPKRRQSTMTVQTLRSSNRNTTRKRSRTSDGCQRVDVRALRDGERAAVFTVSRNARPANVRVALADASNHCCHRSCPVRCARVQPRPRLPPHGRLSRHFDAGSSSSRFRAVDALPVHREQCRRGDVESRMQSTVSRFVHASTSIARSTR